MPEWGVDDRERWQDEQLIRAQIPERISLPVRQLLTTWRKAHFPIDDGPEIVRLFTELVQDHSLPEPTPPIFAWVECRPGQIRVADVVRVRSNAFSGDGGKAHNARVGKVVALRYGDVIVDLLDAGPELKGVHYSPHALEKRVPSPLAQNGQRYA